MCSSVTDLFYFALKEILIASVSNDKKAELFRHLTLYLEICVLFQILTIVTLHA